MPKTIRLLSVTAGLLAFTIALGSRAGVTALDEGLAAVRLRRPVALALADDGKRLLVANRDSGTVSILDTHTLKPVAETRFGRRLSDLAARPGLVLVTDEEAGEVVLIEEARGALRELRRIKVGPSPVGVRISDDGAFAAVACLWPRRLTILDLATARNGPIVPATLDLPFAPRHLLALPGSAKFLVADAFGGALAVVDLRRQRTESVRHLHAHNIRGLALDHQRKGVLLTHQVLYRDGRTVTGDIRSGNVVNNFVRRLALDVVLEPRADLLKDDWRAPLGDVERGAGDPAGVAETADGRLLVALAGVNELAVGQPAQALWTRLAVGARPTAIALDAKRGPAYHANTFGDSVSVVDLAKPTVVAEVRLGPAPALSAGERGEALFYDARLSLDGWYSCHSCHTDGHTNGRLNDNFTDGSFGTPKRVLSLRGTGDTGPWAWDGRKPDLESQLRISVRSTMQGTAPSAAQVGDLAAFLRTLPPPPSLLRARGTIDADARERGRKVFAREKCAVCHTPPTYTSPKTYAVGLADVTGGSRFNPPSLRGVSQGGPYFHDGRAATLEAVFTRHGHPPAGKVAGPELGDLLHFLGSL